jgi:hypothetical protein
MNVPEQFRKDIASFPTVLRALLDAELSSGNEIAEVGHSFPAPPVGAYVKLVRPITTRPRESDHGIDFYDRNSSIYSGEFTDSKRFFFILEPPHPPDPEPDMDAIRPRCVPPPQFTTKPTRSPEEPPTPSGAAPTRPPSRPESPLERFKRSMIIDYEKWHDGIGYDLEVLRGASAQTLAAVETLLIERGVCDWRDVEALAALSTPRAREALTAAMNSKEHEVRAAVIQHAPELVPNTKRTASIIKTLGSADLYSGLSETLDQVEDFHPPKVVEALFRGALRREGEIAVHFAAMLMFVHGKAQEPFDWGQRPFFLKFHTENRAEREAVFRELCEKIGVDASAYLR